MRIIYYLVQKRGTRIQYQYTWVDNDRGFRTVTTNEQPFTFLMNEFEGQMVQLCEVDLNGAVKGLKTTIAKNLIPELAVKKLDLLIQENEMKKNINQAPEFIMTGMGKKQV